MGDVKVEVVSGKEGPCVVINDTRVAGNKPWGGGTIVMEVVVSRERLIAAIDGK